MSTLFYGSVYIFATAIQGIANLFILKIYANLEISSFVYLYTNFSYVVLICGAIFFQGYFLVSKDPRRKYSIKMPLALAAFLGLVYPAVALFFALLIKAILYKFSDSQRAGLKYVALICVACLLSYLINGLNTLYLVATILSIFPFLIVNQTAISIPVPSNLNFNLFKSTFIRSTIDIFLLIPPLVFNQLAFDFLDSKNYLIFQMCLGSLGFGGIVTSIVERKYFNYSKSQNKMAEIFSPLYFASTAFAVVVALCVALFYGVADGYGLHIGVFAVLGATFGFLLTQFRFLADSATCFKVSCGWAFSFFVLLVGLFLLPIKFSVFSAINTMMVFTLIKCVILYGCNSKLKPPKVSSC